MYERREFSDELTSFVSWRHIMAGLCVEIRIWRSGGLDRRPRQFHCRILEGLSMLGGDGWVG